MPKTPDTRQTLYGTSREMLETAERKNEILAEIAGKEYTAPESIPHAQYSIDKRMLAAKQKENELLESIAEGGGTGGGGAARGIDINYSTDVISLKNKDGNIIPGSGATLAAYGLDYDSGTGGLTLTKNGAPMQGQTVALPPYGAPQKAATAAAMTDTSKAYVYTGSESGYINGNWYYYDDTLEAWTSGGVYNATSFETDKTLSVEDQAADAKKTGEAVSELKESLKDPQELQDAILLMNLYNYHRITEGYYINISTGDLTANPDYSVTDFIEINGDSSYFSALTGRYAYYDENKVFISGANAILSGNKSPVNAKYLRVDFPNTNKYSAYIYSSSYKINNNDVDFLVKYPWLDTSFNVDAIDIKNAIFLNLFNKATAKDGEYVSQTNGSRATNENYFASQFISAKENTKYTISTGNRYACYDDNRQFISGGNLSGNNVEFTTPTGTKYIIICGTPLTLKDTLVFAESAVYTPDYKPYSVIIPWIAKEKVTPYDISDGIFLNMFNKSTAIDGYYVESTTGSYNNENENYWRSGFIRVKPNTEYRQSANNRVAFYDENCVYIEGYNSQYIFTSPSNAAFIMVCNTPLNSKDTYILSESANYESIYHKYGVKIPWLIEDNPKSKYDGKNLVCFGDSITNYGYTDVIKADTGLNAINVGLSSGRYAYSDDSNQYVNAFAFHNICYSISTGDWTIPDSINGVSGYETQYTHIQDIKAIDFSTVDFVSIAYGTNDFSSATPFDNPDNPLDINTFKGAIRYCLKTLTEKYPHIKIIGVTPCYRFWSENGVVLYDSDEHTIPTENGNYLKQYVEAIEEVYTEFHLPFVNNYSNAGINKYNRLEYFNITDGLHPNSNGRAIIGHRIGNGILKEY